MDGFEVVRCLELLLVKLVVAYKGFKGDEFLMKFFKLWDKIMKLLAKAIESFDEIFILGCTEKRKFIHTTFYLRKNLETLLIPFS